MEVILFLPLILSGLCFFICLYAAVTHGWGTSFVGLSFLSCIGIVALLIGWVSVAPDSVVAFLRLIQILIGNPSQPYGEIVAGFLFIQAIPGMASLLGWGLTLPARHRAGQSSLNPYGETVEAI